MSVDSVRDTAVAILLRVFEQDAFLGITLNRTLRRRRPSPRGRRFLTQLVYGTVRHRALCDHVLEQLVHQSLERLPRPIHAILRMGVFQSLFCSGVIFPAMVHTSVELAKSYGHAGTARLVNAVLKRAPQSLDEVRFPDPDRDTARFLSIRYSIPLWLVEQWIMERGPEGARALCEASSTECPTTLRVNTLKNSTEALLTQLSDIGYAAKKCTPVPEEVTILEGPPPTRSELFLEGCFTMQDPASMVASHLLEPEPGDQVLDLCAAPGGKATHIAQLTGGGAQVVAVDIRLRKLHLVRETATRLATPGIHLVCGNGTRPPLRPGFDRVLVDAPCTGWGTFRRHPDLKWRVSPEDTERLAALQRSLLRSAIDLCKNRGLVVYAVCTFSRQETEEVAEAIITGGSVEPEDGPSWLSKWRIKPGQYKTLPHQNGMDGFFLMRLRKVS